MPYIPERRDNRQMGILPKKILSFAFLLPIPTINLLLCFFLFLIFINSIEDARAVNFCHDYAWVSLAAQCSSLTPMLTLVLCVNPFYFARDGYPVTKNMMINSKISAMLKSVSHDNMVPT
jgi:hypothetical protein